MVQNTLFPVEGSEKFKVLTLWQPWATLVIYKLKLLETRPNKTTWTAEKGSYLIHAAKKWNDDLSEMCTNEPFRSILMELGFVKSKMILPGAYGFHISLPLGAIIGAVDIRECCKIVNDNERPFLINPQVLKGVKNCQPILEMVNEPELSFGDYRDGRFAWICENQRILKTPIPYSNGQGYYQNFKGDINQLNFLQ